jgi:hypothetical protein
MRRENFRDLEYLEDALERDLSWRKRELLQLKLAINKNNTTLHKSTLIRSGIALLCAHWEGFIRTATNFYLLHIIDNKIKVKDLNNNFIAYALKNNFRQIKDSEKITVYTRFLNQVDRCGDNLLKLDYTDEPDARIVNTESNLSSKLFNEILQSIGLDCTPYLLKKQLIDRDILKQRHEIVHGEDSRRIDYNFEDVYVQLLEIIEKVRTQIVEAAENKKYLRNRT